MQDTVQNKTKDEFAHNWRLSESEIILLKSPSGASSVSLNLVDERDNARDRADGQQQVQYTVETGLSGTVNFFISTFFYIAIREKLGL